MNKEQLLALVEMGESSVLEFKKSTAQLQAAFETICAFLNGQGGTILIGVNDKGHVIGQDVTDSTRRAIAYEIRKIEPQDHIEVSYVSVEKNKHVIVFHVKAGHHAPYVYQGRPYQRVQSVTQQMSQPQYDQLVSHRFRLNFSWEELMAEGYSVEDLDHNLILGVIRKAVEVKRMPEEALRQNISGVLEALELKVDDHLKNAAVALFAKKLFPAYPQCQLKLARFKGIDRHEFLDSELIYGNVFELLEKGLLFIRKHLPLAGRIEPGKLERVETLLIPFNAVREALINALSHKDYSQRSGSISVAIYDDRMELFNDGSLLPPATLDKIKLGFSKPRNPLIADVLHRCNLIEKWGRGIPKIINSCKAASDPEPEFKIDKVTFDIVFKFPRSLKPSVMFLEGKQYISLTARQHEILEILSSSETLKMKEILEKLKEAPAERTLRDDLALLRKLGFINSRGHARTAVWFLIRKE